MTAFSEELNGSAAHLMTGTEAGPTGLMVGPASLLATFQTS